MRGICAHIYIYMYVCVHIHLCKCTNVYVCGDDDDDDDDDYVRMPASCWFFSELRLAIEIIENGFGGFPFKHGNHGNREKKTKGWACWKLEGGMAWGSDPKIEIKRKLPPQLPKIDLNFPPWYCIWLQMSVVKIGFEGDIKSGKPGL